MFGWPCAQDIEQGQRGHVSTTSCVSRLVSSPRRDETQNTPSRCRATNCDAARCSLHHRTSRPPGGGVSSRDGSAQRHPMPAAPRRNVLETYHLYPSCSHSPSFPRDSAPGCYPGAPGSGRSSTSCYCLARIDHCRLSQAVSDPIAGAGAGSGAGADDDADDGAGTGGAGVDADAGRAPTVPATGGSPESP